MPYLTGKWRRRKLRGKRGQVLTVFTLIIGLSVIGALGLLAFEISRYTLAKEQLQTAVNSAALAGSATVQTASGSLPQQQMQAEETALWMFQKNSILGQPLGAATMVVPTSSALTQPAANMAALTVAWMSNMASSGQGASGLNIDPNGRILQATGAYGLVPAFGQFLSLTSVYSISETAQAGIPMLDLMVAFDASGAMDDQTPVTFVNRYWDTTKGYTVYVPVASGTIAQVLNTADNGTLGATGYNVCGSNVNALPPQGLENANFAASPLLFSEAVGATKHLRGHTNTGSPPGNYQDPLKPPGKRIPSIGGNTTFTDLVVNIDGNTTFGGTTEFPTLAVLVEATRYNLDTQAAFTGALLNQNPAFNNITVNPKYSADYQYAAYQCIKPLNTTVLAFINFMTEVDYSCDFHCGGISYWTQVIGGQDWAIINPQVPNISEDYAGSTLCTTIRENYPPEEVSTGDIQMISSDLYLPNGIASWATVWGSASTSGTGDSNVGAAIQAAVTALQSPSNGGAHRFSANRAVVIITGGAPTSTTYIQNAQQAAWQGCSTYGSKSADCPDCNPSVGANQSGIPVFVVGLAQDAFTQNAQQIAFTDKNSNPASGGVCGIAGRGSAFFQVTDPSQVQTALGTVARQLIKLTERTE